jgi:CDP-paratose 2-epimerase
MTERRGRKTRDQGRPESSGPHLASPRVLRPASWEVGPPVLGVVEWFPPGDRRRVEAGIRTLESLGVQHVRIGLAWADWHTPEGRDWYDWLIGTLSRRLTVLPSVGYVPPVTRTLAGAAPLADNPKAFADFLDTVMPSLRDACAWIELPSEPDHASVWDWRLDARGRIFSDIIGSAAYRCKQRGVRTVLGGLRATELNWLSLLCENGVTEFTDAIGLHTVLSTRAAETDGSPELVGRVRRILEEHHRSASIWITEAGCSTAPHDEFAQVQAFTEALEAKVERVYWHSLRDLDPNSPCQNGFYDDERHYHLGLLRKDGTPKLLFRLWDSQGIEGVRRLRGYSSNNGPHPGVKNRQPARAVPAVSGRGTLRPVLITGGAGFIGSNLAERLLRTGRPVILLDNLSRRGAEHNVRYLCDTYGDLVEVQVHDVRDRPVVERLVARCKAIFHLAAQVAVTASLVDPIGDFESNVQGAINVLEAARQQDPPPLLFASTSKVYGDLRGLELVPIQNRHLPRDHGTRAHGVDESRSLDFQSPYGCSKGAADQYVLDYARMYGMPNVVFRMSCIYGPRQSGTEDQGWVAHFALQMLRGGVLTIYGDGKQVRDILYVDDLIQAMLLALERIEVVAGRAFNMGGGPARAVSLLEVIEYLSDLSGIEPQLHYGPRRKGDRSYYVSDTRRFQAATGWAPRIGVRQGISQLYRWITENAHPGARQAQGGVSRNS